jgi:hypothetical protein
MALGTWWSGDAIPELPVLPAFSIKIATEEQIQQIASLTELSPGEIRERWRDGNYVYLAFLDEMPVAYGWVGTRRAGVREIGLNFTVPEHQHYLWDFQTLLPWRKQGVYAHFLQEIIHSEKQLIKRFWILYEPGNETAARSIQRAGFVFVGELSLTDGHVSGFQLFEQSIRASAGAALLALPLARAE